MAKGSLTPKVKRRDENSAQNLHKPPLERDAFGRFLKEDKKKAVSQEPAPPQEAPQEENAAAASSAPEEKRSERLLASIRPHRRPIFPIMFVLYCVWVALASDHCNVRLDDKQDCGSDGMSFERCLAAACFLKDGGPMEKSIKIKEVEGLALGISTTEWHEGIQTVNEVLDGGLVKKHNSEQPVGSDAIVRPGDRIEKALTLKEKGTMTLTVWRSRLPEFLARVQGPPTKPMLWEKVLSAPGTQHFFSAWLFHLTMGLPCWLISGYGLAALPVYMISSGSLAFELTRCCHTSKPGSGQPPCFVGDRSPQSTVIDKAVGKTKTYAAAAIDDARSFFDQVARRGGFTR